MPSRLVAYQSGLDVALSAPPMVQALRDRMEQGHAYALVIAPERTGNYKRRFRVVAGVRNGRAYARLINDATSEAGYPYAVALEFGRRWIDKRTGAAREIKRQRILGRVADALNR